MNTAVATLAAAYFSIAPVKADVTKPSGVYPVKHAEIVNMAKPAFPDFAQRIRMEGFVLVRVQVGVDGKAQQATVTESTSPVFEDVVLRSAMSAQYAPATMPQGPVTSWVEIPFTFKYQR